MVQSKEDQTDVRFDGSNWEDLDRLVALAKFQFLQDDDYDDNSPRRCAYLAQRFTGPALDWVAQLHTSAPATFESYDRFVTAIREAFGCDTNNISALRRKPLDDLSWGANVPVFFAECDRLPFQLNI